jgi:hypothetical protein
MFMHLQSITPFTLCHVPLTTVADPACNLGVTYARLTASVNIDACDNANIDNVGYCSCCNDVTALSNAINTCPDTDLSNIQIASFINSVASIEQATGTDCAPILNSDMCASQFGFALNAGTEFYDARALPPGVLGTKPVSNVGSFTTFPGPQVTSVSMLAVQTVITLAPWNEDSGGSGSSATETAAGGAAQSTGSAKSTGSEGGGVSSATSRPIGSIVLFGLVGGMVACA